jgi:hypothetical protein
MTDDSTNTTLIYEDEPVQPAFHILPQPVVPCKNQIKLVNQDSSQPTQILFHYKVGKHFRESLISE